ncbi:NADP-dependent oxidoreductase [Microbacterium lacus]|uniref:NADP-dependent oxidoreductase n=1 Tax=Microbacterium lacus TaxID=415217 RepID=UPI00384F3569
MSETMKAYVLEEFDAPARIVEVAVPSPGPGQVRVRVRTSSVNPVDSAVVRGFFRAMMEYRLPAIQGRDFAGTVDSVGANVTAFAPGDEVFGMVKRDYIGDGTFAEFIVVDADRFVAHRPDAVDIASAGALGLAGVTALQCVDALGLEAGDSVFINGATGGVGLLATQIAAARGLHVIATARPGAQDEYVRELGAEETIDRTSDDVPSAIRHLHPDGVDGVIDLISRGEAFTAIAASAHERGIAVSTLSAAPAGPSEGARLVNIHSESDPALLAQVADLVASGVVRVPIVASYPFDRIDEAFAALATGPNGKIGLLVGD